VPSPNPYGLRALKTGWHFARLLTRQRVDIVHSHDEPTTLFASLWSRVAGVPLVASRRWATRIRANDATARTANGLAYRHARRVLAHGYRALRTLCEEDRVDPRRIVVVPTFADDTIFQAPAPGTMAGWRRELAIDADSIVIGCVARLDEANDQATLLSALARLVDWWPAIRLVLVGDGPCRVALETQARRLGVSSRVVFAGERPAANAWHHLFDISVLPSRTETISSPVIDAMAAGKPVVATTVGAVPDMVTEGETGRLVPPGNAAALATAIDGMLAHPAKCRDMGDEAQRHAVRFHHANAVLPRVADLYEQVAARRTVR
jgi:glycosyltransferase involved in cell wall biosynthesis